MNVITAQLIGDDTCTGAGITAHGQTPIINLCKQMIAVGIDPDQTLEVFRGSVLAVRVRSIGEAAALEISAKGTGIVAAVVRIAPDKGHQEVRR